MGHGDTGAGVAEWVIVTLLLTVAFLAIFQVVGEPLRGAFDAAWRFVVGLVGR